MAEKAVKHNKINKENKIEKSIRNTKEFKKALERAQNGEFDKDFSDAPQSGSKDYSATLKITEIFTIRKGFCIETGKDYYKLYKEVFYLENPGRNYFETVQPTVYRRVAAQHESGDKEWAEAVAKKMNIDICDLK